MWICHAVRIVTDYLFYFAKVARKKVCLAHTVLMRESCVIRSFHHCAVPMRTFLHFIAYLFIVLLLSNQANWCHCSCCLRFFFVVAMILTKNLKFYTGSCKFCKKNPCNLKAASACCLFVCICGLLRSFAYFAESCV